MSRLDMDWRYLGRGLLVPAVSALAGAVIFIASYWLHSQQKDIYSQLSVDQDAVYEDYDELVYRRRLVDRYHRRYEQFHDLGFIGRENRLDWIETIRLTANELHLPHVNYTVEPQSEVIAPVQSELNGADIQIHLSQLSLEIGLVHELDLLRFFDNLQSRASGLINVEQCSMSRQNGSAADLAVDANIIANCSLKIFSVITSDVAIRAAQL